MGTSKNDKNKDYNWFKKLILRYADISAMSLFISPFVFLGLLKLGEIKTHLSEDWELYLNGLLLVFIIPYTIGIITCLLKINIQRDVSKLYTTLILIFSVVFYGFSYIIIYINRDSKLEGSIFFMLIVFSIINSNFIVYILKSLFLILKIGFSSWMKIKT